MKLIESIRSFFIELIKEFDILKIIGKDIIDQVKNPLKTVAWTWMVLGLLRIVLLHSCSANAAVPSVEYHKCYTLEDAGKTIVKVHVVNKRSSDPIMVEVISTNHSFFKGRHYVDLSPASDVLPHLTKVECPK